MLCIKKRCLLFILIFSYPLTSIAESSKEELLDELVIVTGCVDQIREQKEIIRQQSAANGQQVVEQIRAGFGSSSPELDQILQKELQKYLDRTADLIDVDFAINKYKELISHELNEDDLKDVIKFYHSETGKKFVQSNTRITPEWTRAFMSDIDKRLMAEIRLFAESMKKAIDKIQGEKGS